MCPDLTKFHRFRQYSNCLSVHLVCEKSLNYQKSQFLCHWTELALLLVAKYWKIFYPSGRTGSNPPCHFLERKVEKIGGQMWQTAKTFLTVNQKQHARR